MFFRRNTTRVLFYEKIYFDSFENYLENSTTKKKFEIRLSSSVRMNFMNSSNFLRTIFYPVYFLIKLPIRNFDYHFNTVDQGKKSRIKCIGKKRYKCLNSIKEFLFFFSSKKKKHKVNIAFLNNLVSSKKWCIFEKYMLQFNRIYNIESNLKIGVEPELIQIFLKTYKKKEIKENGSSYFTNTAKNWIFKNLGNFVKIIKSSETESNFFLNAKINLCCQLANILFYIQMKTLVINSKKYNTDKLKLFYPLIKSIKNNSVLSGKINNFLKFLFSGYFKNNKLKNFGQPVFMENTGEFFTGLYTNKKAQKFFQKIKKYSLWEIKILNSLKFLTKKFKNIVPEKFPHYLTISKIVPSINIPVFLKIYSLIILTNKKKPDKNLKLEKKLLNIFLFKNDFLLSQVDNQLLNVGKFFKIQYSFEIKYKSLLFILMSYYFQLLSKSIKLSINQYNFTRINFFLESIFRKEEVQNKFENLILNNFLEFSKNGLNLKEINFLFSKFKKKKFFRFKYARNLSFYFYEIKKFVTRNNFQKN